ncbi:NADH-quinone oxidoreductase subunit J [candidate division KSB1 bacterium]|nr:NADH-quinone oxidoreductase subunit J [candidate division KSB1 bacterium]NIR73360.1 NADH-quinone oxidoreductase subunit J [candidate division KSB1 bacterium]NIS25240.1 NADH-quinone oxidoreductase subunit J [candidate division KSB1 bacterium]NIT72143.1 NADH-quinone oxidoreductase subunit J [candidate division KSB1 bacterium]NIU25949.1 NADH-quinone oxidoreductase subunit J [candidate division KSB1 bacterium]
MELFDIVFYAFAALTIASASVMVFSRNVIYSAVGLLFTFFGVAGIYVLLAADFLAVVQVLIYVGGILVLLLFGVMLSQRVTSVELRTGTLQFLPALLVVGGVLVILLRMVYKTPWNTLEPGEFSPTSESIGTLLMTDFLIPFEIASVLLLAALIGAAFIARKERA